MYPIESKEGKKDKVEVSGTFYAIQDIMKARLPNGLSLPFPKLSQMTRDIRKYNLNPG